MKDRADLGYINNNSYGKNVTVSRHKLFAAISLGLLFLIIPLVLTFVNIIHIFAKYNIRVGNGTTLHKFLQEDIEGAHLSAYLFNVTNPEEFMSGTDYKLKLNEVGPFTYRQIRKNQDLEIDTDAGEIRYTPRIKFVFIPEESINHPRDSNLTLPNISLLSAASMISKYSYWTRMGFNMVTGQMNTKALMNIDANSYLWGYDDPIIALSNTLVPGLVHFDNMGIMERLYDSKSILRMVVSAKNADKFTIKTYNGLKQPKTWDFDSSVDVCKKRNTFIDTYEGLLYSTDLTPETPIRLFHTGLCRIIDMVFTEKKTMNYGADALVYQITNKTYALDPEDKCTCTGGTCADGILDLSYCYYGLPLALTNTHFLDADPKLYERLLGINTKDAEKFRSTIVIEPVLGLTLETMLSIQINIVMRDVRYNSKMKPFSEMVLPVIRVNLIQGDLPEDTLWKLKLMYKVGPNVILGFQVVMTLLGLALMVYSVRILYWQCIYSDAKRRLKFLQHGKQSVEEPLTNEAT